MAESSLELLAVKALLDEAALGAPGFAVGGEQALAEEVAHPFYLDVGLLVVLPVGLEDLLNDGGIDGDDGFFNAAEVEAKGVAVLREIRLQGGDGVAGEGGRIREGAEAGNGGDGGGQRVPRSPDRCGESLGTLRNLG